MDFPVFHLDFLGNRLLFGLMAVVHVLINHGLAVGLAPLVVLLEWVGRRTGDARWDDFAKRLLFTAFLITTSLGALTGVGIWVVASLVNPMAIGSLIRVFFWAWFSEWIVFVTEVGLILAYYLTWDRWQGARKGLHLALGAGLAVASWLTMAIIVAILGFMMDTGDWAAAPSFVRGVLNPIYLPQLAFRTPTAMALAGLYALFLSYFLLDRGDAFRRSVIRLVGGWVMGWAPLVMGAAFIYWSVVPEAGIGNLPVAMATQAFADWYRTLGWIIAGSGVALVLTAAWALALPRWMPRAWLLVPAVLATGMMGMFERVREFVRKPDVIEAYLYANGVRHADLPLLRQEGLLAYATYVPFHEVTEQNRLEAGRQVFRLACTRCHTVDGVNGMPAKLTGLYGPAPWDEAAVSAYLGNMHNTRYYMPPFPGSDVEREALAAWLVTLDGVPERLPGDQEVGVPLAAELTP